MTTDPMAICIHEAGHAVACWAVGNPADRVFGLGCQVSFDRSDPRTPRRRATVSWAGPLAQGRYHPIAPEQRAAMWDTGWSSDLRRLREVDERLHAATRQRADRIVTAHWAAIRAVADALLDHGELDRDQILNLIERADRRTVSDLLVDYARETAGDRQPVSIGGPFS